MGMLANGQAYRLLKSPLIWTPKTMHGQKNAIWGHFGTGLYYSILSASNPNQLIGQ